MNPARLRVLGWAAGTAAAELGLAYLGYWVWFALRSNLRGPDFIDYYTAARVELTAGPARLYDLHLQDQAQQAIAGHPVLLLPYLLPPWSALPTALLGLLGYRAAYVAMGLLSLATLAAASVLLIRTAGLSGRPALLAGALAAGYLPGFVLLLQGQGDGFAVLALALSARFWMRGEDGRAGVLAALSLVKPQLVLLVPVLFLATRSWRAAAAYAGTALALVVITVPFFGLEGWRDYLGLVVPGLGPGFPSRGSAGFSLVALPGPGWLHAVLLLAAAVPVVWALAQRGDRRLSFALAVAGSLLITPYANAHDLSLLLVPLILAAPALPAFSAFAYLGAETILFLGPYAVVAGLVALTARLASTRLIRPPRCGGSAACGSGRPDR